MVYTIGFDPSIGSADYSGFIIWAPVFLPLRNEGSLFEVQYFSAFIHGIDFIRRLWDQTPG